MATAERALPYGHLYGKMLRRNEAAGFVLLESAYAPGLKVPLHSHEHAGFCFVLQGKFERIYERWGSVCGPAHLSFHPSGEKHSEQFYGSGARLFGIQISQQLLGHAREYGVELNDSAVFRGGLLSQLAARVYAESRRMDEVSALAIEGLTLEIMAEASRRSAPAERATPRWLRQAGELLQEKFNERLTLADIAREVRVHPVHLARVFRRHYHFTVGEYVRQLRVEFARRELSTTDRPLSEIALSAGFSSQSHFTTAFKCDTGLTPAEYRRTLRSR
jgi:AraC family transcriptional regulator